jgi:hypothetical protein
MLQSLFYLTTALQVSGVTITHIQEHKTNLLLFFNYALQPLRLIVLSELDVPTFATRCRHARALSGGRLNCGRKMFSNFA